VKIDEVHAADWMIECCKINMKRQLGLSVALNSMDIPNGRLNLWF
jgi:hypothetical protein